MSTAIGKEELEERASRERFELAAFTGLLANPRYTRTAKGELTQVCHDARRYAAEMIRLRRNPAPRV